MGFKNALFVVSQSGTYIVSIQQTVHSALSRGFESCSATGSICAFYADFVSISFFTSASVGSVLKNASIRQ